LKNDGDEVVEQRKNPGFFYGYTNVALIFIIQAIIWIPIYSYGVFFDSFITDFNWSRTIISGASALNNITFGLFCILTARLCQKYSPRLIVSIYGLLLGGGYFLMSQIYYAWQLYFYYGIVVAFSTSIYIAMLSIVARWFIKKRGLMTGVVFSGLGLAGMIGPPLSSWLISIYDWRQAYIILGIASVVIMVPTSQFLKRDPQQCGQLPYGASMTEQDTHITWGLSLREALRTRQFWLICGMYFAFLFCTVMVLVHIVIHAIGLGATPINAANVVAIYGVVSIISVNLMGMSGDRFGNKPTFAVSFLLMAIAFFWLLAARETWQLYIFAIILGIAWGGMQVLFSPLVAELFGLKAHSVILAAAATGGSIGAAIGPLLAGYMFDTTGSYSLTFFIGIIISIIAVILTLLIKARIRGSGSDNKC
jgi:MFS family permease